MFLTIGTTLTISKDSNEENNEQFKSKVVDTGDDFVMIDYPVNIETNRTTFFIDGTKLHVSFVRNNISYSFKTEVTGRANKDIPMLKISYPGDKKLTKIQRREYVRVETAVDVAVDYRGVIQQFVADDISAGGIALNLGPNDTFEDGEKVKLTIALPFINDEIKYINTEAKAVRTWKKNERAIASLQFLETTSKDRQDIIRFCFERQLQARNDA
ncbi:flagellar brake domain-containing protein [Sporosarcina thermotolerans]|uniref:Flagellar brake domain-containing protein n=1 Tax=Sporosarcina thermotolerans TaxID=633404 RepID=A0AAW9A4F1_9BACL|nr:flagellar brake domain-containing protein [Sporosarcina thermotolerans]MDW0115574.1 flagellar brake domain-containing protein [Sporosarcina thermotolerans]WHT47127.1 flagellar brake domain-containing protein [Sporosarcina thermotolerans]